MGLSQIDINLLEAWRRIGAKCRADRMEALRRSGRRLRPMLANPPRAWTLCIRASDQRIGPHNATFDFPAWHEQPEDDPRPSDEFIAEHETLEAALKRGVAHSITLDGAAIRELTRPITIRWPGLPLPKVARILGRTRANLDAWVDRSNAYPYVMPAAEFSLASGRPSRQKRIAASQSRKNCVLKLWGYDYAVSSHGRGGLPVPIVYTPSPIDPNHNCGRPPDGVWGTLWQYLWERMPVEFEQTFQRIAVMRAHNGRKQHRGWKWLCPGRLSASGEFEGCGRTCRMLYAPMPVWTLGQSTCEPLALDMPEGSGLAGQWHPGEHEVPVGEGRRAFACEKCWRVQRFSLATYNGWNRFVAYISGGLLYGREVERPLEEVPYRRTRPFSTRKRAAPKRELMLARLAAGRTVSEIAAEFGVVYQTVWWQIRRAMKLRGLTDRRELVEALRTEGEAASDATMEAGA